jgi:hypothetical protein
MSIRPDFHTELAQLFLDDLSYQRANYYYFVGKIDPWGSEDIATSTSPTFAFSEDLALRGNMMFAKKIGASDVSLVCKSNEWRANIVYDMWDHTVDMSSKTFYVLTDDFRVYKCLDNGNGLVSTIKPTGTSVYPLRTSDGYLWKYMYTIPVFKRSRFVSSTGIPVQRALTDSFYNNGSIEIVSVTNGGSGYNDIQLTNIFVTGSTSGSGATATVSAVNGLGAITAVTVNNGGTGYLYGARLVVTSTGGSGAKLTLTANGSGVITAITPTIGGTGYQVGDVVVISVGGAVLYPVVSRVTGSITDVIIKDPGYGYSSTITLNVQGSAQDPGTGLYPGNSTAILKAIKSAGSIARVTIEDPGQDYPADTATTITVQGDGTGAAFSPVVVDGVVVGVIIESKGSGYTTIGLQIVGEGTGAVATAYVGESDFISDQSVVEQAAVAGAIHAIKITAGGTGYSASPVVTIAGDGTGATATATVVGGVITRIDVDAPGEDYTYATVTITDSTGISAAAYAIMPPVGGHGKDAVDELFANAIVLNTSLKESLQDQNISQFFRQFGIIRNPLINNSTNFYLQQSEVLLYAVVFNNITGLQLNEVLSKNNYKFRVADIDGTTVYLQNLSRGTPVMTGTFTADVDQLRSYTSTSIVSTPTMNKYSGSILYANNVNPFTFNENQGIILRTFITF